MANFEALSQVERALQFAILAVMIAARRPTQRRH
jgi:hypothetical protein